METRTEEIAAPEEDRSGTGAPDQYRFLPEVGSVGSDTRVAPDAAHAELAAGPIYPALSRTEVARGEVAKSTHGVGGDV